MAINKKAITPLMVTVLMVSFAVAVGVVVMNLGRAQVEEGAECPVDIGLAFMQISGKNDICHDGTQLRFTIENGITINVEGLVVNIIGAEKAETYELSAAKMSKAGSYVSKLAFDTVVGGQIRQVKISPKVILKGSEEVICPDKALVVESVANC